MSRKGRAVGSGLDLAVVNYKTSVCCSNVRDCFV